MDQSAQGNQPLPHASVPSQALTSVELSGATPFPAPSQSGHLQDRHTLHQPQRLPLSSLPDDSASKPQRLLDFAEQWNLVDPLSVAQPQYRKEDTPSSGPALTSQSRSTLPSSAGSVASWLDSANDALDANATTNGFISRSMNPASESVSRASTATTSSSAPSNNHSISPSTALSFSRPGTTKEDGTEPPSKFGRFSNPDGGVDSAANMTHEPSEFSQALRRQQQQQQQQQQEHHHHQQQHQQQQQQQQQQHQQHQQQHQQHSSSNPQHRPHQHSAQHQPPHPHNLQDDDSGEEEDPRADAHDGPVMGRFTDAQPPACMPCQRSHVGCDRNVPCSRCVLRGRVSECVPAVYRKRGWKLGRKRTKQQAADSDAATSNEAHTKVEPAADGLRTSVDRDKHNNNSSHNNNNNNNISSSHNNNNSSHSNNNNNSHSSHSNNNKSNHNSNSIAAAATSAASGAGASSSLFLPQNMTNSGNSYLDFMATGHVGTGSSLGSFDSGFRVDPDVSAHFAMLVPSPNSALPQVRPPVPPPSEHGNAFQSIQRVLNTCIGLVLNETFHILRLSSSCVGLLDKSVVQTTHLVQAEARFLHKSFLSIVHPMDAPGVERMLSASLLPETHHLTHVISARIQRYDPASNTFDRLRRARALCPPLSQFTPMMLEPQQQQQQQQQLQQQQQQQLQQQQQQELQQQQDFLRSYSLLNSNHQFSFNTASNPTTTGQDWTLLMGTDGHIVSMEAKTRLVLGDIQFITSVLNYDDVAILQDSIRRLCFAVQKCGVRVVDSRGEIRNAQLTLSPVDSEGPSSPRIRVKFDFHV
ncbi:hypothetical protein CAOG_03422 [Capsaspora owczarzaki ATCC 30864]|uniref:hypothetical protein n=1 Tax=Capsaspora owczarzaki (strain ATCC 30864) TaxID=595528 RepID=UPI000352591B|nr:hypothetical protein CAOG_03422 [Capsaspora owczarzaki ATCC 30864]|eukprot:XP_004364261.2 hypothetical protein CAOG_03422 [Capsaspora owczarzaki ATCC 30864]